ncbi:MAG: metallophosphoesterase, partial [Candidatus Bathyarchaeia archaeon]
MRFAVLADAHIGRSIPLAIAEHRRRAFSRAFSRAVDAIVEAGVDYVFFCGDLFERRTLRPHLVQFAHDELYRLARETE